YAWEREALEFIRKRLPDREPYRAWANFEFIADDGSINEVDLLVLTPEGFFIVEIKSHRGKLIGDVSAWTWLHEGRAHTDDNPLFGVNRKAKKLISLLKRQKSARNIRLPFLDALVFCSDPDLVCNLTGAARNRLCLRDRIPGADRPGRPGILAAIEKRECMGLRPRPSIRVDRPLAKAL
ncbi:MAG: NERD domain-containing protein, partial [Desulfobacterales bacterium]|nr:NERD domain-containing protein [Desulfobacterales bacterium]